MCPVFIFNELREEDLDTLLSQELKWLEPPPPEGPQDIIHNPLSAQADLSSLWSLDQRSFKHKVRALIHWSSDF